MASRRHNIVVILLHVAEDLEGRGYPMAGVIRQVAREVAQSAFDDPLRHWPMFVRWRGRPAAHGTAKKVVPDVLATAEKACKTRRFVGERVQPWRCSSVITIRDLIAAEEALEAAEAESRRLTHDTTTWSAFESMDKRGKRTLNILPAQFERQEDAANKVRAAHQQLLAYKRAFLEGVVRDAEV